MSLKLMATIVMLLASWSPAFSQHADLAHGVVELRGMGGSLTGDVFQSSFAGGVEAALGLNRVIAVTGRYSFGDLGSRDVSSGLSFIGGNGVSSGTISSHNGGSLYEFLTGFRFSAPNRTRITPYGSVGIGGAQSRRSYRASGPSPAYNVSFSSSHLDFALALGGGINYRLTPRTGVAFDVQVVGTSGLQGFVRPTGGFYVRF